MSKQKGRAAWSLAGLAAVVGLALVGAPRDVLAEEAHCIQCWNVDEFYPGGPEGGHVFSPYNPGSVATFWNYMDCHALNSCHSNVQVGTCEEWHVVCGSQAILDVKNAVRADDAVELAALARRRDGRVQLLGDYAVVYGCDHETIIAAVLRPAERTPWEQSLQLAS